MTEKTPENELDALKRDIAHLREEIAALAAGAKKFSETKTGESHSKKDDETTGQQYSNTGQDSSAWADFQRTLEAWIKNEKAIKDLAAELERHPVAGILAAFGLGFIIARLLYGGRKH